MERLRRRLLNLKAPPWVLLVELMGVAIVVTGVALFSVPTAVIVLGLTLILLMWGR